LIKKRKHRKAVAAWKRKALKPLPPPPEVVANLPPLSPDFIVRYKDGPLYFGPKLTQLAIFIARGEIPQPMYLSDFGRIRGWRGSVILEWQAKRAEITEQRLAQARAERERARSKKLEHQGEV